MARYAVIDSNNVVVGVVIWDGKAQWSPPEGLKVVLGSNRSEVGYLYNPQDDSFSAPKQG